MKKQLLAAAVAATMTSVAMADISISGNMKVNSTHTDNNGTKVHKQTHETNLVVTGKTGGTTVHMELALDDNANANTTQADASVEDVWMSTTIGDVTVKAGTWNGTDSILTSDSARGGENQDKYSISGSVADVAITVEGKGTDASTSTKLATTLSGVNVSYKNESHQDTVTASGSIAGLNYAFAHVNADAANADKTSGEYSYDLEGVTLSAAHATAGSSATISGDAYFGDVAAYQTAMAAGDDIKGFGVKGNVAGNTLQAKFITMDDSSANNDVDITKIVATRALTAGATLELTFTDEDNVTASSDKETLDLELSVKF